MPQSSEVSTYRDDVDRRASVEDVLASLEPVDQTTSFEAEDTARLTIDRWRPEAEAATYVNDRPVQPGRRRAIKHASSRGPLSKALPSAPVLLGIAALAVSIGGVLTTGDQLPVSTVASGPEPASALSGSSNIGRAVADRGEVVTRNSYRAADRNKTHQGTPGSVEDLAGHRSTALTQIAADAEKQAAFLELNLWQYPLSSVNLTATFGQYGLWSSYHTGLDFNGDTGDPIYAIANGVVTAASYDGPYGNKTVITLDDGTELWYCHQTSFSVSVGDTVRGGDVIGTVGATGNVTGSHLHVEVRPGGGDPVDPYAAMQQHGLFRD
ncbi:M23 family metallopeptidase [Nocardioides halotolerans]|uniref:M23 family metallopeptidase n=1 Tax=Nocardioides halotolerans TaxID=433660 RepID=UPI001B7FC404|nr:M23 family metallopeptidase [Nocardioides halotolerans]